MISPTTLTAHKSIPSMKPLATYWCLGILVWVSYLRPERMARQRLPPAAVLDAAGHVVSIVAAVLATVATTIAYSKITTTSGRSLHFPTLVGFSLANGICETMLFMASFKVGADAMMAATFQNAAWRFLAGTMSFVAYSGAIHALFWMKILPPHLIIMDKTAGKMKSAKKLWMVGLVTTSVLWGWLYFRYQDFWSFAILHALFDAGIVYCIHYRMMDAM
jgi:hypothetical protein